MIRFFHAICVYPAGLAEMPLRGIASMHGVQSRPLSL
jgi:hypothetical protein